MMNQEKIIASGGKEKSNLRKETWLYVALFAAYSGIEVLFTLLGGTLHYVVAPVTAVLLLGYVLYRLGFTQVLKSKETGTFSLSPKMHRRIIFFCAFALLLILKTASTFLLAQMPL